MANPRRILLSELSSIADDALSAAAAADAAIDAGVTVSPIQRDNSNNVMEVDQVITAQYKNRFDKIGLIAAANKEPGAVHEYFVDRVFPELSTRLPELFRRDVASLSRSCGFFRRIFQPYLNELTLQTLYQAIIDDDRELVRKILNSNPGLLLHSPPSHFIVESKDTWRKYELNETPLAVAAKLCQLEMVELLLPYYDQLAQNSKLSDASRQYVINAREAGLKAWPIYNMTKNAQNEDEIAIPAEYTDVVNSLIDVFANETLAPGQTDFTHLSDKAENAVRSLLNLLVPKTAVALDNHIDVELFQLAVYRLYIQRFDAFTSWEQRDAFCIRVIGLIQTVLSPETAKIFCQGLYNVVESKQSISARAASHKLLGGEPFYRATRESLDGMACLYYCCVDGAGRGLGAGAGWWSGRRGWRARGLWKTYVEQKHQTCKTYLRSAQTRTTGLSGVSVLR